MAPLKKTSERAYEFGCGLIDEYRRRRPADDAERIVWRGLLRAGTSIGANYREAYRARPRAEFISKIGDCLKETDETLYWLELLLDEKLVPARRLQPLLVKQMNSWLS